VIRPGISAIRRLLALAAIAAAIGVTLPASAAAGTPRQQRSSNWAGYADTAASPLTAVSGDWVQPVATCNEPFPTYSAFWVGLGGFKRSSQVLEQMGTDADCTATGNVSAYAWYELVPAPPVTIKMRIHRRDQLSAHVTVRGRSVVLQLRNLTTHSSFTKTLGASSPDTSSAEWIAEAPSECVTADRCQTLPLTDFATARFSASTATTRGRSGSIDDKRFTTTELTLASGAPAFGPGAVSPDGGAGLASPSALSSNGRSFSVSFQQASELIVPALLASPDRLRY
jgi:Peptidase A4 family